MQLTAAETLENVAIMSDTGMSALAIYISVISGYLIVAFLAGNKLTKSQMLIISTIFVVFAVILTFGSYVFFQTAINLNAENDWKNALPLTLLAIQILSILASIKFMLDMRKSI